MEIKVLNQTAAKTGSLFQLSIYCTWALEKILIWHFVVQCWSTMGNVWKHTGTAAARHSQLSFRKRTKSLLRYKNRLQAKRFIQIFTIIFTPEVVSHHSQYSFQFEPFLDIPRFLLPTSALNLYSSQTSTLSECVCWILLKVCFNLLPYGSTKPLKSRGGEPMARDLYVDLLMAASGSLISLRWHFLTW